MAKIRSHPWSWHTFSMDHLQKKPERISNTADIGLFALHASSEGWNYGTIRFQYIVCFCSRATRAILLWPSSPWASSTMTSRCSPWCPWAIRVLRHQYRRKMVSSRYRYGLAKVNLDQLHRVLLLNNLSFFILKKTFRKEFFLSKF